MTDTTPALTAEQKKAKDKAMSKAYGEATKTLRDRHRDEFNQLYSERAKAAGYDWTPPPSAREKALAAARALIADNPDITDELLEELAPTATIEPGTPTFSTTED